MIEKNIELKTVKSLLEMKFYIPRYQRGYRWKIQQVKDLLEDIDEFIRKDKKNGFYCLQPLVVKETLPKPENFIKSLPADFRDDNLLSITKRAIADNTQWEVIDGQQRLTTIYILLSNLNIENRYSITYETRYSSKEFLRQIKYCNRKKINCDQEGCKLRNTNVSICSGFDSINIDYYHMVIAKETISSWFQDKSDIYIKNFTKTLLNQVQFIWYESVDEDPIKVFTRLNIGKIELENSELIKALFLNHSNFNGDDAEKIGLKQFEIASQWDDIEYTLQNDEFWLFIHDTNYNKSTRIEFIFDLICEKGLLDEFIVEGHNVNKGNTIDSDKYLTFRYFNAYFHSSRAKEKAGEKGITLIEQCWSKIKEIFQTLEEWYNDLELYHYVGYLIEYDNNLIMLLDEWNRNDQCKNKFIGILIEKIKVTIQKCCDLDKSYGDAGEKKRECFPLLLLINIQTIINQNKELLNSEKYALGTFYKFPFHLFKKENSKKNGKGWEVEHIASNSGDDLDNNPKNQKVYLASVYYCLEETELKKKVRTFLDEDDPQNFEEIKRVIDNLNHNPLAILNSSE